MREAHPSVTPMQASGIQHQVARVYREGGEHQWVRETLINSFEAGATRVEFGIEWQAVESLGVYRRVIADNGKGMSPDDLVGFFNVWGGGGKPIGGLHENFGIGAKSSLLPWNRHGLVVISWVDGEASMIWVTVDPTTGEYGLKNFRAIGEDGEVQIDEIVVPYVDEEHGCDWADVKPDWIEGHGTVIVLLGDEPAVNTVLGDPNRSAEADIKGISTYLNRRMWEIGEDRQVFVDELRQSERESWPVSEAMAHTSAVGGAERRTNRRSIEGARHFIEYPDAKKGHISASSTMVLDDGTEIDWFLWEGERPGIQSYAAQNGYIAALYKGELYDRTPHLAVYRTFGVLESAVRTKLWIIIRPRPYEDNRSGVYPRGDRNSLLVMGGPRAGEPLPMADWGAAFADNMPDPIKAALRAARAGGSGTVVDDTWKDRLADRFGARWRIVRLRADRRGLLRLSPSRAGTMPRTARRRPSSTGGSGGTGGTGGEENTGSTGTDVPAAATRVAGGIPTYMLVGADDVGQGMLAAWAPNHPEHPEGAVLVNAAHPILEEEITYWQSQYADHLAEAVRDEVLSVYGEIAVAKVAHSEYLKSVLPRSIVDNELRSEAALTMALLGLIGEEAVIAPRVGGKFGRRSS